MNKELLYPFFIECIDLTSDNFWKGVFEDLAYGYAPYGAYVNKGYIICNYKDKEFNYRITDKPVIELYNDIYNLFTTKLNIVSSKEILNRKKNNETYQEEIVDWNNIKKKNIKDFLIENWVIENKKKYNLTIKQVRYLISIIFIALIFKVIVAKDITIRNGGIEKINGISFEEGRINVEKDVYKTQSACSIELLSEKFLMSDEWEKYINGLRKNLKMY